MDWILVKLEKTEIINLKHKIKHLIKNQDNLKRSSKIYNLQLKTKTAQFKQNILIERRI